MTDAASRGGRDAARACNHWELMDQTECEIYDVQVIT